MRRDHNLKRGVFFSLKKRKVEVLEKNFLENLYRLGMSLRGFYVDHEKLTLDGLMDYKPTLNDHHSSIHFFLVTHIILLIYARDVS